SLRHRLAERRNELRKVVARAVGSGREEVWMMRTWVVADVISGGLAAAERTLVEEEDLEVLAPAEAPVDTPRLAEGHRLVVAESLHAVSVELAPVPGDREVIDEFVVVPLVVEARGSADPPHVLDG